MAIITVMTKLFTTVCIFRRPGWDDLMIVFSLVGSIVASSLVQTSADLGLGRPPSGRCFRTWRNSEDGQDKDPSGGRLSLPNAAILILIERLVGKTKTIPHRFLRVVVAIQTMLALASVIIIFVQCRPTKMLWDQSAQGECWSPHVFNYTSYVVSGFTVFTDLVLAIVPIHAFWKLQLKVQEKLEITFMLGLTFLSAISPSSKLHNWIHSTTEQTLNIVIMATSVPTLRPLLRLIKDKHPMRSAVGYIKSGSGTDPKHNASVSEIPLGNVQQRAEQGSEPSWETHSSSEELNGRRATPPFE
uniref:Rhodopsin domain-containing protein n=1 Tax=Fusarium oxysporum (strain Fo5176) TaxID=660025 RepID=A0A0D2Y2T6_FUSOF